jgi:eukaryotic-like serine/threonine-protein kinase
VTLDAGDRLGAFEILAPLGEGGMGRVYRARDVRLGREVAVKVLPAELSADPGRLRRFEKEARTASGLNHPTIVTIYEVGSEGSVPFIAMELVSGRTLRDVLLAGPLPIRRALSLGAQLGEGLAIAHEAGLVHRDLKPENVMVTRDGLVKILDFGLAKLARKALDSGEDALSTLSQTQPGGLLGTVGYMSPEQAAGQPATFASDQFSLGAMLYEMASGKRAFQRPNAVDTLSAILHEDPTPLDAAAPESPAPLQWIVERCLAKDPAARYGSTRDLARDLANLRDRASGATSDAILAMPRFARRRAAFAWVLAIVAALAAGALAVDRLRHRPAPGQPVRFTIAYPPDVTLANTTQFVEWHNLAVSPDGRRIAFVAATGRRPQIWIRPLDRLSAEPVSGTEGARSPFWSPDGNSLAFFADEKLKRIPLSGGLAQVLCSTSRLMNAGSWGSRGTIVFAQNEWKQTRVFTVPQSGGTPRELTTAALWKKYPTLVWPRFLPDGRHFLVLGVGEDERTTLLAGDTESSDVRQIGELGSRFEFARPDSLFYVREGTLEVRPFDPKSLRFTGLPRSVAEGLTYFSGTGWAPFSVSDNGVLAYQADPVGRSLEWVDRRGNPLGTAGPPGGFGGLRLSNDGRLVAVERYEPGTGFPFLWVTDISRSVMARLTVQGGLEQHPVWSPDGDRIIFSQYTFLKIKRANDSTDDGQELLPGDNYFPMDWSLDGKLFLYVHFDQKAKRASVCLLPMTGNRKPLVFRDVLSSGGPGGAGAAALSPDSRWIAFVSDVSGREEVYVAPVSGSGQWQVSTDGVAGQPIRWRRDGRELFYVAADHRLMSVAVEAGAGSIHLAAPVPLFRVDSASFGAYDVAPDGQRFLRSSSSGLLPITVALDWKAQVNW